MKAHVNNSYIRKIHKQHNINYEKYVFVGNYYYLFGKMILGDPGAVSWGRKNGVKSFQERKRGPQGCFSWRTSFTTYSNNFLWFGTKNNLVPYKRFFTSYFIDVDTFYLYLNWSSTRVGDSRKYVCGCRLRVYKYTKIEGPRFQRNYIIARDQNSDLHGTSFQSSPKINRMLNIIKVVYNTRPSQFCQLRFLLFSTTQ